jgi:phosphoenolpyruvate-protein phosphotransferase (PTS system enzyme I)
MTLNLQGQAVSRGVAIGRAVLVASSRMDVAHFFVEPDQVEPELKRLKEARRAVCQEIEQMQQSLVPSANKEAHHELTALLDVHLMLLQDEQLQEGVKQWVQERLYNAEWALTAHLEQVAKQFDEMEDPYLRERKADLEQVVERMLRYMRGHASPMEGRGTKNKANDKDSTDVPMVLVAHDLSPADMMHFKQSVFTGFVTDVGGKTSHTAIVARSLDIPAVVGVRNASQLVQQDDWVIIDGDAGHVIVNPTPDVLTEYQRKQKLGELERERLWRIKNTPAVTLDGERIELLANIEVPEDTVPALAVSALGIGLFRTEFLFMGRNGQLPDEDEQYQAYRSAIEGMHGLPVTIRTVDVGADKPLDRSVRDDHLNPALGMRAVRWSLSEPDMFLVQLRAILRAAAHGKVNILVPMIAHMREIEQVKHLLQVAKDQLDAQARVHGPVRLGAMIEVPAAALMVRSILRHFDFVSIGTNDLIQYTLAVDRVDESVAHLYDPMHPAVLQLVAQVIAEARTQNKGVSVCGEMAGDPLMTRLLLGLGLRSFSMHPSQMLMVKQQILQSDTRQLRAWAQKVVQSDNPALEMAQGH